MEHIVRECEVRSLRLLRDANADVNPAWLEHALRGCAGVTLTSLIQLYHRLHRAQDPVWQVGCLAVCLSLLSLIFARLTGLFRMVKNVPFVWFES